MPLEVEHIILKSRGGTDRVSELTVACKEYNREKGNRSAAEFGFPHVQEQAKEAMRDVAAVNAIRWELWRSLHGWGLPPGDRHRKHDQVQPHTAGISQGALDRCCLCVKSKDAGSYNHRFGARLQTNVPCGNMWLSPR
ncbi:MAG: hypothetical protein GX162_07765 [Firmicutes bacterium]|nr:hypothetical protein [Bacillota bacterium]